MQFHDPELEAMLYGESAKDTPCEKEGQETQKKLGKYIAIEGPDGSGKTLACSIISELIKEAGAQLDQINILSTHENSLALRKIVTNPETQMHPRTELAFYIAAVLNSITQIVKPATLAGMNILTDRGPDSSLVYQCMSLGDNDPAMIGMHAAAFAGLAPDATIYLDPPSAARGLDRCSERGEGLDRLEKRPLKYHEAVLSNYKLVHDAKGFRGDKVFWVNNHGTIDDLKVALKNVLILIGLIPHQA